MLSSPSTLSTNQTQVPLTAHAPHNHTADCQCSQAAAIHPANFLPMPPNDEEGGREGSHGCNCRKSKCLKLYCECFAAGYLCAEICKCQECRNNPVHKEERDRACEETVRKNARAFEPKIAKDQAQVLASRSPLLTSCISGARCPQKVLTVYRSRTIPHTGEAAGARNQIV